MNPDTENTLECERLHKELCRISGVTVSDLRARGGGATCPDFR